MRIQIIYPEKRWVSEDWIRSYYSDLLMDGDIEDPGHEVDLWEAIDALNDLGVITTTGLTQD